MPENPKDAYLSRLHALKSAQTQYAGQDRLFVGSKLAVGLLTIVLATWLAKYHSAQIAYIFVPIAVLIVLFVTHERVLGKLRRCKRLTNFYEQGVARLEDRWAGTGQQGEHFLNTDHPYARDLDLFGKGSVFELLCTARTRAGEDALASWLMTHAAQDEIKLRQQSVQELTPLLDFRERLALAGEDVRMGVRPESLIEWSESSTRLGPHKLLRVALPFLTLGWIFSLVAWFLWDWGLAALVMSLLNLGLTYKLHEQAMHSAAGIEQASHDLDLLAHILTEIEQTSFTSAKLLQLQRDLECTGVCPSQAIRRLNKRVQWLDSYENWFVKLLDLFIFWMPQWVIAAETWRAQYGSNVRKWIAIAGEVEALTALGNYAYERPEDTFPEFVESGPYLQADTLAHPLLPRGHAVANDLQLDSNLRLIVISGPNMAGKSTFIRSLGVNVVLAQAGAPVCASRLRLSSLTVAASISILDSLQGGLSRFYAEIMRLKKIDELSRGAIPVLFLLDELLSGTNSHDRRIGTESFVRSMLNRGAIGLITTHDLALAEIADKLEGHAANYHFADSVEDGKLHFDYRLTPGVVQTANALKLMRSIGLDV